MSLSGGACRRGGRRSRKRTCAPLAGLSSRAGQHGALRIVVVRDLGHALEHVRDADILGMVHEGVSEPHAMRNDHNFESCLTRGSAEIFALS